MTEAPREDLATLRRRAASTSGPARTDALVELGRALYTDVNDASIASGPLLDETIEVLAAAYQLLDPVDDRWLAAAIALANLYGLRYLHGDFVDTDRVAAEAICEKVLESRHENETARDYAHLILGKLMLAQALPPEVLRPAREIIRGGLRGAWLDAEQWVDFSLKLGGIPYGAPVEQLDRAIRHLTRVSGSSAVPEPGPLLAAVGLSAATVMRDILGGHSGGVFQAARIPPAGTALLPEGHPIRTEFEAFVWLANHGMTGGFPFGNPQALATAKEDARAILARMPEGHVLRPLILLGLGQLLDIDAAWSGRLYEYNESLRIYAEALAESGDSGPFTEIIRREALETEAAKALYTSPAEVVHELFERLRQFGVTRRPARDSADEKSAPGTPRSASAQLLEMDMEMTRERFPNLSDAIMGYMATLCHWLGVGEVDDNVVALQELRTRADALPGIEGAVFQLLAGMALSGRANSFGTHADLVSAEAYLSSAERTFAADCYWAGFPGVLRMLRNTRATIIEQIGGEPGDSVRLTDAADDHNAETPDGPDTQPFGWLTNLHARVKLTDPLEDLERISAAGEASLAGPRGGAQGGADSVTEAALRVVGTFQTDDPIALRRAFDQLRALPDPAPCAFGPPGTPQSLIGLINLRLWILTGDRAAIDQAIVAFERAWELSPVRSGSPLASGTLHMLAVAHRHRDARPDDRTRSANAALAALAEDVAAVFLQPVAADGFKAARSVADFARRFALDWLVDDRPEATLTALELSRGLVVHSATTTTGIPEMLRAASRPDLAEEWERTFGGWAATAPVPGGSRAGTVAHAAVPDPVGLRIRVMTALAGPDTDAGRALFSPYDPAAVAAALRALGRTALAYLVPGERDRDDIVPAVPVAGNGNGWAVLLTADGGLRSVELPGLTIGSGGPLDAYLAAQDRLDGAGAEEVGVWERALEDVCDWAGPVVVEPLLAELPDGEPHVTLVPCGALSTVPWHAARLGGWASPAERACQRATFTYAATARQLVGVAARRVLPLEQHPVFVGNPGIDLWGAEQEVTAILRRWYPDAVRYGGTSSRAGHPDEILVHLPGAAGDRVASLLHLGCRAVTMDPPTASYLELAPPAGAPGAPEPGHLTVDRMLQQARRHVAEAPGGLVVLSACRSGVSAIAHDEGLTIATSFVAAGAASVVASLWDVPDLRTAVLMYMLHDGLQAGLGPAEALRAAQRWMLDPDRVIPDGMAPALAEHARSADLSEPVAWAAFTCLGR